MSAQGERRHPSAGEGWVMTHFQRRADDLCCNATLMCPSTCARARRQPRRARDRRRQRRSRVILSARQSAHQARRSPLAQSRYILLGRRARNISAGSHSADFASFKLCRQHGTAILPSCDQRFKVSSGREHPLGCQRVLEGERCRSQQIGVTGVSLGGLKYSPGKLPMKLAGAVRRQALNELRRRPEIDESGRIVVSGGDSQRAERCILWVHDR
jgi:hypothetical protein